MSGPIVGRLRELGELERALGAIRTGSGTTVLVAGEAGIAKTRLALEFAARAGDAGVRGSRGALDLVGTELPYQPFVEVLRPLGPPPQVNARIAGSQLAVIARLLAAPVRGMGVNLDRLGGRQSEGTVGMVLGMNDR